MGPESDSAPTELRKLTRMAENHPVISVVMFAFVALFAVLGMIATSLEIADRTGMLNVDPRPPERQVPIGFIDTARIVRPDEAIELYNRGPTAILQADRQPVVSLEEDGVNAIGGLDPNRLILVAALRVAVNDRSIGADMLANYITVESVYEREKVTGSGLSAAAALRIVEGDVLTVLGEYRFQVQRIWHRSHSGRPIGDPENSIILAPIRSE